MLPWSLPAMATASRLQSTDSHSAIPASDPMLPSPITTLSERKGGLLTNSEGGRTMAQTWGKPASWVDYSGEVEGEKVGVALFEHPASFHHPSRWHVRDYGLLAVNPFGANAFDKALPVQSS